MVVISIIGLLASIILIALNNARMSGRDALRVAQVKQLGTAIQLYYDKHQAYPNCDTTIGGGDAWCGDCSSAGSGEFKIALQPLVDEGFITQIPQDPINNSCYSYQYYIGSEGNLTGESCGGKGIAKYGFIIIFRTENTALSLTQLSHERISNTEYCFEEPK